VADDLEAAKAAAARYAVARFVRPPQRVALGTGTTAQHAVREIARVHPHADLDCVASSRGTEELARSLGIPVRALAPEDRFDLMLDGADEVTPEFALTKGGGGALLREKLLAHLSRNVVILVDPTKLVTTLGERAPIPVEIVPFAAPTLQREIGDGGFDVSVRKLPSGTPVITDNANEILDLRPRSPVTAPALLARSLRSHVGVVETGIFVRMARRVVVGHPDGRAEELPRARPSRAPRGTAVTG
jgi:ribose 5-phosphate isomerase A